MQANQATKENTRVPIGNYQDPKSIGRVLSLDLIGPLPASKVHKHIWIIVVVDVFSKYVFAKACTKANANQITEFLEKEVFYRFETPEIIVTDNGTQFESDLFEKILQEHGIKHILTPVYHLQANPVESSNKSVKQLLRAELVAKINHVDWSSYLHKIVKGVEHRMINDENLVDDCDDESRRELIYQQASEEQRAMFEKNRMRYNMRTSQRSFKPGDIV